MATERIVNEEGLRIRVYPDPVLKIPSTPVERFDEELASFVGKMRLAMDLREGVGLAAPQVGVSKKIAVVAHEGSFYVLINPRLLHQNGTQGGEEGCLSFPGIYAPLPRPAQVRIAAQDTAGVERIYEMDGLLARVFLHEMDHLEGKLFIDRLSSLKRGMIRKKMYKRAIEEERS